MLRSCGAFPLQRRQAGHLALPEARIRILMRGIPRIAVTSRDMYDRL